MLQKYYGNKNWKCGKYDHENINKFLIAYLISFVKGKLIKRSQLVTSGRPKVKH